MKIINVEVDWMERYGNDPHWVVTTDTIEHEPYVYKQYDSLYVAELECGLASFFHYVQPDRGFAGRVFDLLMQDGTRKALMGPWSSNSMAVNKHTPHRLVEATWCVQNTTSRFAGSFTMVAILDWLASGRSGSSQGAALTDWLGGLHLTPVKPDGTLKNEDNHKNIRRVDLTNDVCCAVWCDAHGIQQNVIKLEV